MNIEQSKRILRRKGFFIALCIVFLGVILLLTLHLFGRPSAINQTTYGMIKLGMSRQQVQALIGAEPGDYARGKFLLKPTEIEDEGEMENPGTCLDWTSNLGRIEISLDEKDNVQYKAFTPVTNESLLSKFIAWVERWRHGY